MKVLTLTRRMSEVTTALFLVGLLVVELLIDMTGSASPDPAAGKTVFVRDTIDVVGGYVSPKLAHFYSIAFWGLCAALLLYVVSFAARKMIEK